MQTTLTNSMKNNFSPPPISITTLITVSVSKYFISGLNVSIDSSETNWCPSVVCNSTPLAFLYLRQRWRWTHLLRLSPKGKVYRLIYKSFSQLTLLRYNSCDWQIVNKCVFFSKHKIFFFRTVSYIHHSAKENEQTKNKKL